MYYDLANPTPILPDEYPALCTPRYGDWKTTHSQAGEMYELHRAIDYDDVPAIRDFIRLVGPDLLHWEDKDIYRVSAPLVYAAEMGRNAILTTLLDYRDSLSPEERNPEWLVFDKQFTEESPNSLERIWGTPLTTACMCAHEDTVRLLLARMPEVDINVSDRYWYTPLLAVAKHSRRAALSANGHGYLEEWMVEESKRRVAIVRLLLAHGANPQIVRKSLWRVGDEEKEPPSNERPVGRGSALVLALAHANGADTALVRVLVDEAGIDVHQGCFHATEWLDGTGLKGTVDYRDDKRRYKRWTEEPATYLTPLAAAALYRNAPGVEALLQTPGADFTTDLVAPSVVTTFCDGDTKTDPSLSSFFKDMTAMRPLHAAMVGSPRKSSLEPEYDRVYQRQLNKYMAEDGPSEHTPFELARIATAEVKTPSGPAIRMAFFDDCVTTVRLLTADEAVCAATINATHPYKGGHYTPLHLGARFDRLPMVRVLLDKGADPSIPMPQTDRSVFFLVFASLFRLCGLDIGRDNYSHEIRAMDASIGTAGMKAIIGDLLRPGPKTWKTEKTEEEGEEGVVRRLAMINEADEDGNTALHWAAGFSLSHAQAALLALGARADARNQAGEAPTEGKPPTSSRPITDWYNKYD